MSNARDQRTRRLGIHLPPYWRWNNEEHHRHQPDNPPGGDEKRWVDGVLARKKGLGL